MPESQLALRCGNAEPGAVGREGNILKAFTFGESQQRSGSRYMPKPDAVIKAGTGESAAIGRECQCANLIEMSSELADWLGIGSIKETNETEYISTSESVAAA